MNFEKTTDTPEVADKFYHKFYFTDKLQHKYEIKDKLN